MTNGVSKRTWDLMEWEPALHNMQSVVLGVMPSVLHLALPNELHMQRATVRQSRWPGWDTGSPLLETARNMNDTQYQGAALSSARCAVCRILLSRNTSGKGRHFLT